MTNKYKLCRVYYTQHSTVRTINEEGQTYGDVLLTYEDDGNYYYAIYENLGDEQDEDWDEYSYFDQDFDKALEEYKRLKGE